MDVSTQKTRVVFLFLSLPLSLSLSLSFSQLNHYSRSNRKFTTEGKPGSFGGSTKTEFRTIKLSRYVQKFKSSKILRIQQLKISEKPLRIQHPEKFQVKDLGILEVQCFYDTFRRLEILFFTER